jgi:hypothetical protein
MHLYYFKQFNSSLKLFMGQFLLSNNIIIAHLYLFKLHYVQ